MTYTKTLAWTLMAGMMLGGVGCVSQKQADDLQTLYRRSQEQVIDLKAQLDECNKRVAAMASTPKPQPQMVQDPNLLAQLQSLQAERARLNQALAEAQQALIIASQTTILPVEMDNDLQQLAQSNGQMMSYDKKLGMIKFSSDLTFASGSVDVSAAAKASLAQLAVVMKKPIAEKYELRIVGNTDNVRIGKPATRAAHPTNWHLSVHRAIAVKDVLAAAGVDNVRLQVAGNGEYRPVVPNTPRKGNPANRRVEIYIVPLTYQRVENTISSDGPEAPAVSTTPDASAGTSAPTGPEAFK